MTVKRIGVDFNVKSTEKCSVPDCGRQSFCRGFCGMHYVRVAKHGDPNVIARSGRPLKGDVPTFAAVHKTLSRLNGPAKNRTCIDCGESAAEWSYDGLDPNELHGPVKNSILAYSLDLAHYVPRCVPCHRRFDLCKPVDDSQITELHAWRNHGAGPHARTEVRVYLADE